MRKWRIPLALLTILAAMLLYMQSLIDNQSLQKEAERWQGESATPFLQIAAFLPSASTAEEAAVTSTHLKSDFDDEILCSYGSWKESEAFFAKRKTQVEEYQVSSDFFRLHSFCEVSGAVASFQSEDGVAILNEEAAWRLFGSNQCIGEYIAVGEETCRVLAVITEPQGSINARAFGSIARIYTKIKSSQPVTFYEFILPEYYTGFAVQTVHNALGTAVITACTERFQISTLWAAAANFFCGSQQEAVNTPPWEFSAQQTQRQLCLLAAICIAIGVSLICFPAYFILQEIHKKRNRQQSGQADDTICGQAEIAIHEAVP